MIIMICIVFVIFWKNKTNYNNNENSQWLLEILKNRISNVTSTLDKKIASQHIMDVEMLTSIQRYNCNVKFITSSRRWYYDVETTLRQLYKERKRQIIHGHMLTFPQSYLKIVKNFINDMTFVWYAGLILWH